MKTYKIKFGYFEGNQKKSVFITDYIDNEEEAIKNACSLFENIKHYDHYDIEDIESADFE